MNTPSSFRPIALVDLLANLAPTLAPAPVPASAANDHDTPAETLSASHAERELAWYFGFADAEAGRRSNARTSFQSAGYGVVGLLEEVDDDLERRINASHAARLIERRLAQLSDRQIGVLYAAHEPVAWPREFLDRYGTLAGVVMRLIAAEHDVALDDGHGRRWGERIASAYRTAEDRAALAAAYDRARFLYREARAAYDRARGGPDGLSIVSEGER